MPFGLIHSQSNWTVGKNNTDTIITYKFTKNSLLNLRVYVTGLEEIEKLYHLSQMQSLFKDSVLVNQHNQIINQQKVISLKDSIINIKGDELQQANKWGQSQEKLKIKYYNRAKIIPYTFVGGGLLGIILCLLLHK